MTNAQTPLLSSDRIDSSERQSDCSSGQAVTNTDYGSAVYRYPLYLQPGQFTSLEKLMFFISSVLFIVLCVFAGLYARRSFDDDLKPPPPYPSDPTPGRPELYCLEPNCIISAAHILQDINQELDPCDDFYAYTCSNWVDRQVLTQDPKVDLDRLTNAMVERQLHALLTHDYRSIVDATRTNASLLPPLDQMVDQQLFAKLQDFYASCMDQERIDQLGIAPMYGMFRAIQGFLPLDMYQETEEELTRTWTAQGLGQAIRYVHDRGVEGLFGMHIQPDPLRPTQQAIVITPIDSGLPPIYYDDPDIMTLYTDLVVDVLTMVFEADQANEFGWKLWSPIATARRLLTFERELAKITTASNSSDRYSLAQLQTAAPHIDWSAVMDALVPRGLIHPPDFLVSSVFVNRLEALLSQSNSRALQLHFIWQSLWTYMDTLGSTVSAPRKAFEAKIAGAEPATIARWQSCLSETNHVFGMLLGRYYVLTRLDPAAVSRAEHVVSAVANAFTDNLDQPWLRNDPAAIAWITEKMHGMLRQLGYPHSQPDIHSPIDLAEQYGDINVNRHDFFGNVVRARLVLHRNQREQFDKATQRNIWTVPPQQVTSVYDRTRNHLVLPAALLQPPFYDPEGPDYLNYGALGARAGQEMLRGFDQKGLKYDSNGRIGTWWSKRTQDRFKAEAQCMVNQYEAWTSNHDAALEVDGERILNSNLADHGALGQALAAWERYSQDDSERNPLLPGLGHWTRSQLFYIQYARMLCSKSTPEYQLEQRRTGHHAPSRWRVNGPLMNSNHFAEAFSCAANTPMNPTKKCKVW